MDMRGRIRALQSALWKLPPVEAFRNRKRAGREAIDFAQAPPGEIPILVYQMTNVGSLTVVRTLESIRLDRTVHHVHHMTAPKTRTGIRRHLPVGIGLPYDSLLGHALGDKIRQADSPQIPVITLVRDPIARELSECVQAVVADPSLRGDAGLDADRVLQYLERRFRLESVCQGAKAWFDQEVKQMLGIDVFALPFPKQAGYAMYQSRRARVLLLRMEDFDRVLGPALAEFLDLHEVPKIVPATAPDCDEYNSVVEKFRLPRAEVERVYADRLTRHFYPAETIERFTERWTRPIP